MAVGPWKPIRVEAYNTRIAEMRTEVDISDPSCATVAVHALLEGDLTKELTATVILAESGSIEVGRTTVLISASVPLVDAKITIQNPKLWYPVGQGQQPLYEASLIISDGHSELSKASKRIGLRKVQIVQKALDGETEGGSFYFEVNGRGIFAGGMAPSRLHNPLVTPPSRFKLDPSRLFPQHVRLSLSVQSRPYVCQDLARAISGMASTARRRQSEHGSGLGRWHL